MSTKANKIEFGDMAAFGAVALMAYWMISESCGKEGFTGSQLSTVTSMMGEKETPMPETEPKPKAAQKPKAPTSGDVSAYEQEDLAPVEYNNGIAKNIGTGCNDLKFVSTNLLPKGDAQLDDTFEEFSPANLEGQNFLDSKNFQIGMQSQVLRNANLQLRSEPTNPQEAVCAWNQSTIGPETRREMNIGSMANKLGKTVDGVM
jgi:hypothetical protein